MNKTVVWAAKFKFLAYTVAFFQKHHHELLFCRAFLGMCSVTAAWFVCASDPSYFILLHYFWQLRFNTLDADYVGNPTKNIACPTPFIFEAEFQIVRWQFFFLFSWKTRSIQPKGRTCTWGPYVKGPYTTLFNLSFPFSSPKHISADSFDMSALVCIESSTKHCTCISWRVIFFVTTCCD